MMNKHSILGFLCGLLLTASSEPNAKAAVTVTLTPSVSSPAPLGTLVHWSAAVDDTGPGPLWYRFRSGETGASVGRIPGAMHTHTPMHMIVDYGPSPSFDWTEIDHEGAYLMEVSVQDKSTGETATATASFTMTSRLQDANTPVISPTNHPLVFLYSAPGCRAGGRMAVQFQSPDGTVTNTPYQECKGRASMNFYLAGMRAETPYQVRHTVDTGSGLVQGPTLTVTTGSISITPPNYKVYMPPLKPNSGILFQCGITVPTLATDLLGNVVWYYAGPLSITTRAEAGGYFLGIVESGTADPSQQLLIKYDVAGTTLLQTNAARINEQLAAVGRNPINAFHHEAAPIAGGRYLVLADTERILTGVQGPGAVDVIGDEILVLDSDLQLVWAWDAFDHLDASRMAVLGEVCPSGAGCAPYHLAATADDWLHGNSLQLTPDGHILYSSRHQDWLLKINYNNGLGDGSVIWRLGMDGDFQYVSADAYPWFSHQHDARMEMTNQGLMLLVFDDGNTRVTANPGQNSRGQVWKLDEQTRTATLLLNADMGGYSYALGAAQLLPNGNAHFDAGWISEDPMGGKNASRSIEVDPAGNVVYGIAISAPEYRTFRMPDLYTPQG